MSGASILKKVWVLMAIIFVDMVGYLVVLPLLPFYAEDFGASEIMVGALIAAFAFAQVATAPLWGRASDRYGRRGMILASLVVSTASYVLFGLANSVALLLVSRLVQGVGAGTIGVVHAYISDAVKADRRTEALAWVTVASSTGVMLGPVLGSLSVELGHWAPGFVAAGLCLLNLVFAWRFLPESSDGHPQEGEPAPEAPEGSGTAPTLEPGSLRRELGRVLFQPGRELTRLIWIYALGMMAFMALNGVVALYLERVFDFTEESIGWFYFYIGGLSALMRGLVVGPVVRWLGEVRLVRIGAVSIALGLALVPFAWSRLSLALMVLFIPVGTALLFPATTSLVSQASRHRDVGQSLGVQQAFGGISRMVGPLWATAAFQYLGIRTPFWLASALMGMVLLIALTVPVRREREERQAPGVPEADSAESL